VQALIAAQKAGLHPSAPRSSTCLIRPVAAPRLMPSPRMAFR
jgi:hypothetical protein